jgi:periplasmic protein CpxP/Spy
MKNRVLCLALSSFLGLGAALAAQAPQDQSAAPQAQAPTAQQNGHRAVDPNRQIQMLAKKLNLTADQQNQILPILTDRQQQMAAIWNDSSLSKKDRHDKVRAIREDSKNKIDAVLSADQKQTYEQMLQRQHQHRKDTA